ncbi:SRPBCC domain-containing protein [Sedimentitalea sp.]|uniref:SRPBCC family protein n=1 Tax=Sedimentitalea sp. TaxID=2048915 RepID=UPI003299F436
MTDTMIRKSIYLNASPEQVWNYLTDPDKLALWFHKPTAPLEQGNELRMYGAESGNLLIWGTVKTARRPSYIEYTFVIGPMGDAVSLVKWTLDPVAGGTRLSLEHSGLPQGAEGFGLTLNLDEGWDEHMSRMRALLHESA